MTDLTRDLDIIARVAAGDAQSDIARDLGLTRQRVSQIVHGRAERARQRARDNIDIPPIPCQACGQREVEHRHHPDYDHPLLVWFLCPTCHAALHRGERLSPGPTYIPAPENDGPTPDLRSRLDAAYMDITGARSGHGAQVWIADILGDDRRTVRRALDGESDDARKRLEGALWLYEQGKRLGSGG